jgi:hypothetical protein
VVHHPFKILYSDLVAIKADAVEKQDPAYVDLFDSCRDTMEAPVRTF